MNMQDFPSIMKCSFCGKDAKRIDRQKTGIYLIATSFVFALFSFEIGGWILALIDWLLPFMFGLYWALKAERYVYHCKHCTTYTNPYEE